MSTAQTRGPKTQHVCSACNWKSSKWVGRCGNPECAQWDTMVEEVVHAQPSAVRGPRPAPAGMSVPISLPQISAGSGERLITGITELDRVLGGGVVPGSLILLAGDPGIGKSTLALQAAGKLGTRERPALYVSGEESAAQVRLRADRLGCVSDGIRVLADPDLQTLLHTIQQDRPRFAIVDSIQTIFDPALPGGPGGVTQVREAAVQLLFLANATGVPVLINGHVTKEKTVAGPKTLEHTVDVVLYLEGERNGDHRLLRSYKNRFGPSDELGVFEMTGEGLIALSAEDASRAFINEATRGVAGNVLTITCEGSRPLAVEVQALVTETSFGLPRRVSSGFDLGRLHLLLAVLEKRCGLDFSKQDVYLNIAGGIKLTEPAGDLAVALAVAGSLRDLSVPADTFAVGEVGLGGEIRRVRRLEERAREARALGLVLAIGSSEMGSHDGLHLRPVKTLLEALEGPKSVLVPGGRIAGAQAAIPVAVPPSPRASHGAGRPRSLRGRA